MRLSIIIVHYNVAHLLRQCLLSIQRYVQNIDFEVIVVDNNSPKNDWELLISEFPAVTFIRSEENLGFSRGNNLAAAQATGDYLLLLNPDTEIEDFYMQDLVDFADSKPNFGCLGVRLHDVDGKFLPESKRAVPDLKNSFQKLYGNSLFNIKKSYYRDDIKEYDIAEVEVVTGAFLLVRREVYTQLGGLDPAYFMYGEDIDFCYTLLQHGYKNYYYGAATVLHYKGESTVKDARYLANFYGAMSIFLDKYYSGKPVQKLLLKAGMRVKHGIEWLKLKKAAADNPGR